MAKIVKACFTINPESGVTVGQEISFSSCSEEANWYFWGFGDGTTSTLEIQVHTSGAAGTYTIKQQYKSSDYF